MNSYGIHKYEHGAPMPRHRHAEPYMAIVVEGGYLEAGDVGRIEARPGDVLLHGPFEAHRDSFGPRGATVLNLPLGVDVHSAIGRLNDIDAIVRVAEWDAMEASAQARSEMVSDKTLLCDWPDLLAAALRDDADLAIAEWADRMGLATASVSRGFARTYGISPKRFRFELRARRAINALSDWQGSLAALAAEYGFADQAHFTRAAVALTGRAPSRLKTAVR